jgi:hypothetical protein
MTPRDQLLELIKSGKAPGFATADSYFSSMLSCFGDGAFCPREIFETAAPNAWDVAFKDSAKRLTYSDPDAKIGDMATKGMALSKGSILDFDCIITTRRKDRDGDILEPGGATVDPACPLLWQHIPVQPIGKMISKTLHTKAAIGGRFAIYDTPLGRDAAVLVEAGALRISHGFEPEEFEPLNDKEGRYYIPKYTILETSLVSIPSNVDAVITAFSREKLHSPLIKGWAKSYYDRRPVLVKGGIPNGHKDCHCGGKCPDCQKSAAEHHHESVRHEGESMQDCVSRKIGIMESEGGRTHEQIQAIAYSMCGEKALMDMGLSKDAIGKLNLAQLKTLLNIPGVPSKGSDMSDKTVTTKDVDENPSDPGRTPRRYEDEEGNRGQGPQQGDHDWAERHMSEVVIDEVAADGVTQFDVLKPTHPGTIWDIATGSNTAPQRNPAPYEAAPVPGTNNQPGVPTPTLGVPNPPPKDPGFSPGPQRSAPPPQDKNIHNANEVSSFEHDGLTPNDPEDNINTEVDTKHLKHVAGMIHHSGKEGSVYLHPEKGHVHHVAHPDDLHPDNSHMYHGHDEINKLYKSVRGVKGVKIAIQQHPMKGSGYMMMHKVAPLVGNTIESNPPTGRDALTIIKQRLIDAAKIPNCTPEVKAALKEIFIFAHKSMEVINPTGGSMMGVPADNAPGAQTQNFFTGMIAPNGSNAENTNEFNNIPEANVLNRESRENGDIRDGYGRRSSPATVIPGSIDPGMRENVADPNIPGTIYHPTVRTDPGMLAGVDAPNIPESVAFTGMTEKEILEWLDKDEEVATVFDKESKEFDDWLMEQQVLESLEV